MDERRLIDCASDFDKIEMAHNSILTEIENLNNILPFDDILKVRRELKHNFLKLKTNYEKLAKHFNDVNYVEFYNQMNIYKGTYSRIRALKENYEDDWDINYIHPSVKELFNSLENDVTSSGTYATFVEHWNNYKKVMINLCKRKNCPQYVQEINDKANRLVALRDKLTARNYKNPEDSKLNLLITKSDAREVLYDWNRIVIYATSSNEIEKQK